MRTDSLTGLPAFTRAEVEELNRQRGPAEVVDWDKWPELTGYVVEAGEPQPFVDPQTGEGLWGNSQGMRRRATALGRSTGT